MSYSTRNSLTTEYTYNDASWVTKIDYPNSTNTNYSYNNRGWMTGIELKDNSNNSIFALPYTYDANGNVTEESVGNDTIAYTYDALNRLTFIDRPGTGNDTTYTYDERGNRTQMETNSITNYLTFNAADELTRVDKPSNAYDTYTYDNNGNCTQMDRYYPQPLLASNTDNPTTNNRTDSSGSDSSKDTENNSTNSSKLLMTHYPADYAPYPINKWHNLSPYLPDVSQIDPISAKIASMIPDKAEYDRERRWREIAMPQTTPDETTSFTYSSDNNLTHVDLTDGSDLDFKYDAAGRRLEKKYTTVVSGTTYETKYTYHYIGSQITTIDIYQTQTTGETTTTTKDDQMRIHLGANTRPISFEYYTKNLGNEQVTSATYYYHYDLHGNVILVTDSSGTTQITYTYDQLGTITSETNTNSIYNPFTYMGEAQIIQDSEFDTSGATPKTGLYASGSSYYNPETGTSLGGSGAPAMTNPSSGSMEEPTAQCTRPAGQLGAHAAIAGVAGGVPVSVTPVPASSVDVVPEKPAMQKRPKLPLPKCNYTLSIIYPEDTWTLQERANAEKKWEREYEDARREVVLWTDEQYAAWLAEGPHFVGRGFNAKDAAVGGLSGWLEIPYDVRQKIVEEELKKNPDVGKKINEMILAGDLKGAQAYYADWVLKNIIENLEFVLWDTAFSTSELLAYKLKGQAPVLFKPELQYDGDAKQSSVDTRSSVDCSDLSALQDFYIDINRSKISKYLHCQLFTNCNLCLVIVYAYQDNDSPYSKDYWVLFAKIFMKQDGTVNSIGVAAPIGLGAPAGYNRESLLEPGSIIVARSDASYSVFINGSLTFEGVMNKNGYFFKKILFNTKTPDFYEIGYYIFDWIFGKIPVPCLP